MSCHPRVTEGTAIIRTHLPHLTKPQATVSALWSLYYFVRSAWGGSERFDWWRSAITRHPGTAIGAPGDGPLGTTGARLRGEKPTGSVGIQR